MRSPKWCFRTETNRISVLTQIPVHCAAKDWSGAVRAGAIEQNRLERASARNLKAVIPSYTRGDKYLGGVLITKIFPNSFFCFL